MRRISVGVVLVVAAMFVLMVSSTSASVGTVSLTAKLSGFREVPPKLTAGSGTFSGTIAGNQLSYKLSYSGLSTPALFAHIHFGQSGVNGAVTVFLCGGGGTPACPVSGTVTGTATAASVIAVPAQGITAGDFNALVAIVKSGDGYVNVHTTNHPDGEIRGQIKAESDD